MRRSCLKSAVMLAVVFLTFAAQSFITVLETVPAEAQQPGDALLNLPDHTWRQLDVVPSARYLAPGYVVTPTPVADPNPRTRAYSGLVAGSNRIFYFGGGHLSYPGNDVEVFDPRSLRWDQAYQPEVCPYTPAAPPPCYDIYNGWGTMVLTPLGRPYVEHAYQVYGYDPVRNRLLALLNNGTWAYDLASRQWTALVGPAAGAGFSPTGTGTGNRHLFGFDAGLGAFQAVATAGGTTGVYQFDDKTRQWVKRGAPPETNWSVLYSTHAADRGVHFVYAVSWTRNWWKYDASTNQWTPLPAPPATPDSFDYDSRNRVVVAVNHSTAGVLRVMVFDPDASRWTELPSSTLGPTMRDGINNATGMAWRYIPAYNAFVLLAGERGAAAGGASTTWAYRYKGDIGPAVAGADLAAPTVTLTAPADGAHVSGTVRLAVTAADNVGVTAVHFRIDGVDLGAPATGSPYAAVWDTTQTANGTHTVIAVASDAAGNIATTTPITVTVDNATASAPTPPPLPGAMTFAERCAQPGVVRCFGFDSAESIAPFLYVASDGSKPTFDPTVKASGPGSLKMTVPSLSKDNTSGAFTIDFTPGSLLGSFTDPYPDQFGEGQEFYVQWRQRFSPEFLTNKWAANGGGGWKQAIIGEGDRTGVAVASCTQIDVVVNNYGYRGFPRMYHSCGEKDGQYQGLYETIWYPGKTTPQIRLQNMIAGCIYGSDTVPPCVGYKPDQWMTFQVHVKVGTWYKNDHNYHRDSTVEMWVAEENQPSVLVISITGYDLANENPAAKFGKVWLTPFNTGKDISVWYPVAYTWYDDLIIARNWIPDAGPEHGQQTGPAPAPAPAPAPPPAPPSPATLSVISSDKNAPQTLGTTVAFTASAKNGKPPYQYKWWVYNGTWQVAQNWSASSAFAWTPATANAAYAIRAWVRSAGNTSDSAESALSVPFEIDAPLKVMALTADKVAPQPAGSRITFTAAASGGNAPYQYKWWLYTASAGWQIVQAWSASNTFAWTPATPNASYAVKVWIKSASQAADTANDTRSMPFVIQPPPLKVTALTADKNAPQLAGTRITFTAAATGGTGPYQYKWWVMNGNAWRVAQDWSTSGTFAWTPTTPNPADSVRVWIKSAGNSADAAEDVFTLPFPIQPRTATITGVTVDKAAPQKVGTTITLTAIASGGTAPYQYQWWMWDGHGWLLAQGWSSKNIFAWTPQAVGPAYVTVWVKSGGNTTNMWESSKPLVFTIQ